MKTKFIFWWWVIKYRGKKNIPPEVIFNQLTRSVLRMRENLEEAMRISPGDSSKEEMKELRDAIFKVRDLQERVKEMKKRK